MKTFSQPRRLFTGISLIASIAALLSVQSARAATTYTWANSNTSQATGTTLNWFNATQGTWTGGTPVSLNTNTVQFFNDVTTAFTNTTAYAQTSNIDNSGAAFALGILTLDGKGSATAAGTMTMTIKSNAAGDALNFSAATGTINLNAVNGTAPVTFNVNPNIQLGTASINGALTITGNGTGAFNIGGNISELKTGGGSVIKSGTSMVTLSGTNAYTGTTAVNAGTLEFAKQASLSYSGAPTAANITTASGATTAFAVGGSGFTSGQMDTVIAALVTNATATTGFKSGSSIGFDTTGGSFTYNSTITNAAAGGTNTLGLAIVGNSSGTSNTNKLTLGGTNTYSGGTTMTGNAGNLVLTNSSALGTGTLSINATNSVTLNIGAAAQSGLNIANDITVASTTQYGFIQNLATSSTNTLSGNITLNKAAWDINSVAGGTLNLTNTLTNGSSGVLNFNQTAAQGTVTLSHSGGTGTTGTSTTVRAGTVNVTSGAVNPFGMAAAGGSIVVADQANATLSTDSVNHLIGNSGSGGNGTLTLGSTSYTGTLDYTGSGSETVASTIPIQIGAGTTAGSTGGSTIQNNSGTTALVFSAANFNTAQTGVIATTARVLTLQGSSTGANEIQGIIQNNTVGGSGTGNVAVTKAGNGTWKLSGANTYTGDTTVSVGTLLANTAVSGTNSATGAGTVSVTGTGILGGIGQITPGTGKQITVANGGIIAPGDAGIGTLTLNGANTTSAVLSLASGAKFAFELNNGPQSDKISLLKGASAGIAFGGNVIDFSDLSGGSLAHGPYTLFTANAGSAYSGLSTSGSTINGGLSIAPSFLSVYTGSTLQLSGNDIVLNVVPEPATWALLAFSLTTVMVLRRRRA